ncbi:hypothetical protein N431DRAFT_330742 [Stipitochalara longipes BDJ]|nr:hypothetical protein N431DRAFT_330742 [Stipitochalara longipes BDJ]
MAMNNPWKPGAWARLPWSAFAALAGAIGGVVGSVAVLVVSNGKPIADWHFQPTVYLSIISTITNLMVHYALTQGATIAWWTRALKPDTKISHLHQYWETGNSLLASLKIGRNFNAVALASIIVAISQVNGPLLQRASRVAVFPTDSEITVSVGIASKLPSGYTGMVEGRGYAPAFFNQLFLPTVSDYYDRASIKVNETGCIGTCSTIVAGAGFAVSCSSYETTFNAIPIDPPAGQDFNTSQPLVAVGVLAFQTNFLWSASAPGNITLNVEYKPDNGCEGPLIVKNCTLSPAIVQYSVAIDGNSSTISLPENSTIYDDEIESTYTIAETYTPGSYTTYGGLSLALANRFNSWANLRFAGGIGYDVSTSGATSNQFVQGNTTIGAENNCSLAFNDPTTNLLNNARELMFRTAIAAANSSNIRSLPAQQQTIVAVYQSHYLYLGLASLFTTLAIILIVPTFIGYWKLGRTVSMSPIEIGKAFNAPLLRSEDSNADADNLIQSLGHVGVRYGVIQTGAGNDGLLETSKQGASQFYTDLSWRRLEMAPPEYVIEPRKGWEFGG